MIGDGCYSSKKQASITLTNSEKNIIEKVSKKLGDEYLLNPINETRKTNTTSYTIVDTTIQFCIFLLIYLEAFDKSTSALHSTQCETHR